MLRLAVRSAGVTAYGATVTETASKIGRDATIGGQDVVLNGAVAAILSVEVPPGFTINAPVGRDVQGEYQNLVVGTNGKIAGMLSYAAPQTPQLKVR